jgi:hypothetical protein
MAANSLDEAGRWTRREPNLVWALGELGAQAEAAGAALEKSLTDSDVFLRLMAACSLWRTQRRPDRVVPVILDALKGGQPAPRQEVRDSPPCRDEMFRAGSHEDFVFADGSIQLCVRCAGEVQYIVLACLREHPAS